jgi:hypothetical protein
MTISCRSQTADAVAATDYSPAVIGEQHFLHSAERMPKFVLQVMRVITERLPRHGPR